MINDICKKEEVEKVDKVEKVEEFEDYIPLYRCTVVP
jgi:hypothetical protein